MFKRTKTTGYNDNESEKKLIASLSHQRLPSLRQFKYLHRFLAPREKNIVNFGVLLIIATLIFIGVRLYGNSVKELPANGESYTEAVIGTPKFINPLYASLNDVDADIASLVYSALFKRDNTGKIVPDLAQSYTVSADQKTYTIKLKSGVKWQNGDNLTPDDIFFTYSLLKDPQYRSPLRQNFAGAEMTIVDANTVQFTLAEPYVPFLSLLTFGIMPSNLWDQATPDTMALAELNLKPIGSGPFKFKSFSKNKDGVIKSYTLTANPDYFGAKAHLGEITFRFYNIEPEVVDALNSSQVDGAGYLSPEDENNLAAKGAYNLNRLVYPRLVGLFFNLKNTNPLASEKKLRQALALALPKPELVKTAAPIDSRLIDFPFLPDTVNTASSSKYNFNEVEAKKVLTEAKLATSTIKLTTLDDPEYLKMATAVATAWQKIGLKVDIVKVASDDLQNTVIKNKDYTVLLYSLMLGADSDLWQFWHSQSSDFNLSNYASDQADALLTQARTATDAVRLAKYSAFANIFGQDLPAIMLYNPPYTYPQNKKLKGFNVSMIYTPRDRFANVAEWYIKTKKTLK